MLLRMGYLEGNRCAYLRLHGTPQTIVGIHRRVAQIQILKNNARLRNPRFSRNAAQTIERSSGKLILFLTCQSNPGPALRGSWLLAFSLQFVIRAGLHFDLIKPKGMAPNQNQSQSRCKRGFGWRKSSWQSELTLISPLPFTAVSIARADLVVKGAASPETWLRDRRWRHRKEGVFFCFFLAKYGLLVNWIHLNVLKPQKCILPGGSEGCGTAPLWALAPATVESRLPSWGHKATWWKIHNWFWFKSLITNKYVGTGACVRVYVRARTRPLECAL